MRRKILTCIIMVCIVCGLAGCKKDEKASVKTEENSDSKEKIEKETEKPGQEENEVDDVKVENYSNYQGTWQDTDSIEDNSSYAYSELNVEIQDTNTIVMFARSEYPNDRIEESTTITAELVDGKADFEYYDTLRHKGTGNILLKDDKIVATFNDESLSEGENIGIDISDSTFVKTSDTYIGEDSGVASPYMPESDTYQNGSDYNASKVVIETIDDKSFKFAIYQGNDLVFKEHVAYFYEASLSTAVFRGKQYVLRFYCDKIEQGQISISGFEEVLGDNQGTFWNVGG